MSNGTLAVFDVDETLITCKSMFSYLAFAYRHRYGGEGEGEVQYQAAMQAIQKARQTQSREKVNRAFYQLFVGWHMDELRATAIGWFMSLDRDTLFIPEILSRYKAHVQEGDTTVLLTGSASFIVAPIAQFLFADAVLAIELEVSTDGTTTGGIAGIQTIGQGKADALLAYMKISKPARVIGYGDHESDLPFLRLCDQAFVVTTNRTPPPAWAKGLDCLDIARPFLKQALLGA